METCEQQPCSSRSGCATKTSCNCELLTLKLAALERQFKWLMYLMQKNEYLTERERRMLRQLGTLPEEKQTGNSGSVPLSLPFNWNNINMPRFA